MHLEVQKVRKNGGDTGFWRSSLWGAERDEASWHLEQKAPRMIADSGNKGETAIWLTIALILSFVLDHG